MTTKTATMTIDSTPFVTEDYSMELIVEIDRSRTPRLVSGHRVVPVRVVAGELPSGGSCPSGPTEGAPQWGTMGGQPVLVTSGGYARIEDEVRPGSSCAWGTRGAGPYAAEPLDDFNARGPYAMAGRTEVAL